MDNASQIVMMILCFDEVRIFANIFVLWIYSLYIVLCFRNMEIINILQSLEYGIRKQNEEWKLKNTNDAVILWIWNYLTF